MSIHLDSPSAATALEPILSVRGVAKNYQIGTATKRVLIDVTFDVYPYEFVCIVGPSGAGKTTLLRCLAGLLPPTSGELYFEGEPVNAPPAKLALVFQDYSRSLMPWLTVSGNVLLPLANNKSLSGDEKKARAQQALAAVGLGGNGDQYPWQLSGGMQQRAAIARALAYRPDVLVMDEPFASVDAQTRADLEDLILDIQRRFQVTVVLVTHDIDEAVYLADRVVVISGAPSKVSEIVEVPIPRPRDQIASKATAEYAELRAHVLGLIQAAKTSSPQPFAQRSGPDEPDGNPR